jgi:hypothetical protein
MDEMIRGKGTRGKYQRIKTEKRRKVSGNRNNGRAEADQEGMRKKETRSYEEEGEGKV